MADPKIHLEIIEECFSEVEREIKLVYENGHFKNPVILRGIMDIKLTIEKIKSMIRLEKENNNG